jgi:hypothetical protein
MEALLEREGQVENWNDDRLDELSRRMDNGFKELKGEMKAGFAKFDSEMKAGFAKVDSEMKEGFASVDRRFERVNERLDKLIFATWATGGAFAATAFAALVKVAFF